ncbi:MAG TPA: transcription termination factor NusA [Bacillota bacterium]|nr:transcription termination/antitermination protein NusA [Clostridiales bacterium]HPT85354.1 transcription termination factor NusA [Bacillota bacterium]
MNNEFFAAIEMLEKEKGIPKEYMYEKVEAALQSAYKKDQDGYSNVKVVLDPVKKEVKMYQLKQVVDEIEDEITQISLTEARKINPRYKIGDTVEIELKPKNFRRLGAQAAKHVIIQAVREAERGMLIKEYENKREEIITATVLRVDEVTGNATVDTGTSIATLIKSEQIPGEVYRENQHIKVYVTEVRKETHGPIVTLSRTHPGLVKRLFELEVPEIQDGIVIIKGVVREAGSRSKVAVMSRDPNVDPIGACVGPRSMRIQNIIDELNGEKIDIIKYSDEPEEYIAAALSPATVNHVVIEDERVCRVYVDPDQLSLAIGKEGQNARLAAKLTGYKIDIKTG